MKQAIHIVFTLTLALALFTGCQEESVVIIEPPLEDGFTVNSSVARFAERVALRDGSDDNIISGGSCLSFELPVEVVVNGTTLLIESEEDLSLVEFILDEYDDDEDEVRVIFPVTIILQDYTRLVINTPEALEEYIDECEEGGIDDDIECVDFNYPVQISVYDTQNQVTDVVTITNDEQLYVFLNDQDDDVYMSFIFPITLIYFDGTQVVVNNHTELEAAIDLVDDACDEDDDNDYNDDDVDDSDFRSVIQRGNWLITAYIEEGENKTGQVSGWTFRFNNDGTVTASRDDQTISGNWFTSGDDGVVELDLIFPESSVLDEISEDWDVLNYTADRIDLADETDSLIFEKQ